MKKMLLINAGVVLAVMSYTAIAYDGQNSVNRVFAGNPSRVTRKKWPAASTTRNMMSMS